MKKIVLTGAAGRLGSHLREPLSRMCGALLSTDIAEAREPLYPNETHVRADLAQMDQIAPLMAGAEAVVHFGAIVDEAPFETLWGPNFIGSYNVWEAGYRAGVRRRMTGMSLFLIPAGDMFRPWWPLRRRRLYLRMRPGPIPRAAHARE